MEKSCRITPIPAEVQAHPRKPGMPSFAYICISCIPTLRLKPREIQLTENPTRFQAGMQGGPEISTPSRVDVERRAGMGVAPLA